MKLNFFYLNTFKKLFINLIIFNLLIFFTSSTLYAKKGKRVKKETTTIDKTTIKGNIIILEDGHTSNEDKWTFLGPDNKELGVKHISNDPLRKNVVHLKSFGLTGTFIFKNSNNKYFNYNGFSNIQWKMKYKNPFVIQILVETNKGTKYLVYSNLENVKTNDKTYFHIGLGPTYSDGSWRTVTRNLNEDIKLFNDNLYVKFIKGISFNGTGYIDDIWLLKSPPLNILIEDGDSSNLKAWDRIGKGGKIRQDYDNYLGGTVYFNSGSGNAAFRLRKEDGSYWKIKTNVVIQWKMKMKKEYKIYVIGDTNEGKYIISYESGSFKPIYNKEKNMIRIGLGDTTVDDKWRVVTRNISDDIKLLMPGIDVSSVSSIIIRGHGWIDDVKLLAQMPSETNIAKGWDIFDDNPDIAKIRMVIDDNKGEVISLMGEGLRNGYRYTGKYGKLAKDDSIFIRWDMKFDEKFDIMLLIDTETVSKVIHYIPEDLNYMRKDKNELFIGVGKTIIDGRWHTIVRSLKDDLEKLDKNAKARNIKALMVRGSGYLANIDFSNKNFVIEQKKSPSAVASIVIGQYNFSYNLKNLWGVKANTKSGLYYPNGLFVDNNENLLIADTGNSSIKSYRTIPLSNGVSSDNIMFSDILKRPKSIVAVLNYIVVSDSDLNKVFIFEKKNNKHSLKTEINSVKFNKPSSLFYDGTNLFISDSGNSRVLMWEGIPLKGDENPDLIIGQSRITSVKPNQGRDRPTYNTLKYPNAVYSNGISLYIADTGNNRVLFYEKIPKMDGWHADYIIGQDSKSDNKPNRGRKVTKSSLNAPEGVFLGENYLYVADTANNRVLIFDKTIDDNAPEAIGVLGQVNYTDSSINRAKLPSTDTLFYPSNIFIHNGIILISDTGNNRVLVY